MHNLYNRNRFTPSRGGHAPGHLRDAFLEMVESGDWRKDSGEGMPVGYHDTPVSFRALTGLLWNCTDVLPGRGNRRPPGSPARLHPARFDPGRAGL